MNLRRKIAATLAGASAAFLVAGLAVFAPSAAVAADAPYLNPNPPVAGTPAALTDGTTPTAWWIAPNCDGTFWSLAQTGGASYTPATGDIGKCVVVQSGASFFISQPIAAVYAGPVTPITPGVGIPVPPGLAPLTPIVPAQPATPSSPASPQCGTHEAASGGVALPGGGGSVAPGGLFRVRLTAGANEHVALAVSYPGASAATVLGGTTDGDGNAFFNIRVPRRTAAGAGTIQGASADGTVIFDACFDVAGRAVHPAAG